MSSEAETLKIVAEVVDKFSKPLQDLRKQLQDTGGNAKNKQLERSYEDIRKSVRGLRDEVKGGLTPALAVFGLTAFSVGGAMAAVASSLRTFASSTNSLSLLRRETGLTIDTMRQWQSFAARMGSTPEAMSAGFSAFARNAQEFRKGIGGTFTTLWNEGDAGLKNFLLSLRKVGDNEEMLKRVLKFSDRIPDPVNRQRFLAPWGIPPELGRVTGAERENMMDKIKKDLGPTTKEAQEAAEKFEAAMARMQDSWSGLQTALGNSGALDEITKVLKKLREFTSENQEEFGKGATKFFGEVGDAARTSWGWMQKVADSLNELKAGSKDVKPWVDIPKFLNSPFPGSPGSELRGSAGRGLDKLRELFGKKDLKESTKEGASEGIQEGIRKMMLEGRPGGDFGEGARVWKASYGGGGSSAAGGGGSPTGGGAVQAPPMGGLGTRGDRNNNPGNIKFGEFARGMGATGADDRGFAVFPSPTAGHAAMGALLKEKYKGLTLGQIGNKWANNPGAGYLRGLENATGLRGDQVPDLNDPSVRGRLMQGIMRGEGTGGNSLGDMIRRGAGGANFMKGQFGPAGSNLTEITTPGGKSARVHQEAAPAFQGFLSDLEKAGAPLRSLGGYNYRSIAGSGRLSQHAYGNALDINQQSRNVVSRDFAQWARANQDKLREMQQSWGITSGGDWKNPDFGHFEWNGKTPWLDKNREADRDRLNRDAERNRLFDSASNSGVLGGPNLDGNAKLQIDLNGFPKGTKTDVDTSGIFTDVKVNRGRSMPIAE